MAYAALTTLADVKGWLRRTTDTDDALLSDLIGRLSDQVGRFLGRDNLGSVEAYTETYRVPRGTTVTPPRMVLRHYPVVALSSVKISGQSFDIITDPMAPTMSGAWVEDDRRTLTLFGSSSLWPGWSGGGLPLCQIQYTAGYATGNIPGGLSQAVIQWVAEISKSQEWIGYVSKSLAGETVSYEMGREWGMSKRTKGMLEPFRDRIPMSGAL
jgi:hypothetical protein